MVLEDVTEYEFTPQGQKVRGATALFTVSVAVSRPRAQLAVSSTPSLPLLFLSALLPACPVTASCGTQQVSRSPSLP